MSIRISLVMTASFQPVEVTDAPEFLGVFSPRRAGALAGVSGYQVGQWARYGLIRPTIFEGRPANMYAFYDVAEAIIVHWLRDRLFSYPEIHRAIQSARREHPHWPLIRGGLGVARHTTDPDWERDRGVIVQEMQEGVYEEVGRLGRQVVLDPELLDFAQDMLRQGGWIAWANHLDRIEVEPTRLGGAPTLKDSRWPIERVANMASDDQGWVILQDEYGLAQRDVEQAVTWTEAAESLMTGRPPSAAARS